MKNQEIMSEVAEQPSPGLAEGGGGCSSSYKMEPGGDLFSDFGNQVMPHLESWFKPAAECIVKTSASAGEAVKEGCVSFVDSPMSPFSASKFVSNAPS